MAILGFLEPPTFPKGVPNANRRIGMWTANDEEKQTMKILELLYNGKVHYRRPENHPDIKAWREVIKWNPLYRMREVIETLEGVY